jgi:hypothetical protein
MLRARPPIACQLLAIGLLALGCARGHAPEEPSGFAYFAPTSLQDPWSPKIAAWQARERTQQTPPDALAPASVSGSGADPSAVQTEDLRTKYQAFRREQKRAQARETASWIQETSRAHYHPDGAVDHWATLEETLEHDGDDCDGLELLAFYALRDLGFRDSEVFRAIVYRPADGQHHMVTLWFETPEDPWVIDPTGAMTRGMPHMSEVPGWLPLKIFSDSREYTPHELAARE